MWFYFCFIQRVEMWILIGAISNTPVFFGFPYRKFLKLVWNTITVVLDAFTQCVLVYFTTNFKIFNCFFWFVFVCYLKTINIMFKLWSFSGFPNEQIWIYYFSWLASCGFSFGLWFESSKGIEYKSQKMWIKTHWTDCKKKALLT